jgi:hypothetical protein
MEMNLARLKAPFSTEEIEWRIQKSGIGQKTNKPYAMVLAYVSNRAIQERLDDVVGPENWQNQFAPAPNGEGVICRIGIKINGEWVWKEDGAENTMFEAIKGGLSAAMKRAAVQWGIGRYLYNLEAGFAQFSENGKHKDKIENTWYRWDPPPLPSWAMPSPPKDAQEAILKANATEKPVKQTEMEMDNSPYDHD